MNTTPDFITPSEALNRALQASLDLAAGHPLTNARQALLEPAREILEATGHSWNEPAADVDLNDWASGYQPLDQALSAAGLLGGGATGMDVGLMLADGVEQVLQDLGLGQATDSPAVAHTGGGF